MTEAARVYDAMILRWLGVTMERFAGRGHPLGTTQRVARARHGYRREHHVIRLVGLLMNIYGTAKGYCA